MMAGRNAGEMTIFEQRINAPLHECSAYCRPKEGIHALTFFVPPYATKALMLRLFQGAVMDLTGVGELTAIDAWPAHEAESLASIYAREGLPLTRDARTFTATWLLLFKAVSQPTSTEGSTG